MKCLTITIPSTISLLIISLSLGSNDLYLKQKDWEWKELPSIFDLNTAVREADYGRSDKLATQDWSWSDTEREVFRASDNINNNNNINILGSGLLKKTSRLEPSLSE